MSARHASSSAVLLTPMMTAMILRAKERLRTQSRTPERTLTMGLCVESRGPAKDHFIQ